MESVYLHQEPRTYLNSIIILENDAKKDICEAEHDEFCRLRHIWKSSQLSENTKMRQHCQISPPVQEVGVLSKRT